MSAQMTPKPHKTTFCAYCADEFEPREGFDIKIKGRWYHQACGIKKAKIDQTEPARHAKAAQADIVDQAIIKARGPGPSAYPWNEANDILPRVRALLPDKLKTMSRITIYRHLRQYPLKK